MTRPASKHERALPAMLAAPGVQLGVGLAALLATAGAVRHDRVGPREARAFRAVNGLPDSVYLPAWAVMQLGAFGAIPASAAAAWLAGDEELAARLLIGGTGTWALAKAVKRIVRRPRPVTLLPGICRRGRDASGLGYLSGHAGVAVALGVAALPRLGPGGRALTLTAIPLVGLTRVYVGAHFPLDIAGGAALGLAVNAAAGTAVRRYSTRHRAMTVDEGIAFAVERTQPAVPPPGKPAPEGELTPKQLEVTRLIADDLTNRQIAARLFLSERTVETHITKILNKLGLNSRVQLTRWLAELPEATRS